ncbi:MAG: hypothetical protein IKP88_18765 [Lachnospiraceae bacterium]|nr:hypothetical protein [Lachnospiraceae bacterium]
MKENSIVSAIGNIDDDLVLGALNEKKDRKSLHFIKWGAIAACLCLPVVLVIVIGINKGWFNKEDVKTEIYSINSDKSIYNSGDKNETNDLDYPIDYDIIYDSASSEDIITNLTARYASFFPENNDKIVYYELKGFDSLKNWGLITDNSQGLTPDNTYKITKKDIGSAMGIVGKCENADLVGKTIYHFASYPENDVICILDNNGEYTFYQGYFYGLEFINSEYTSEIIFNKYILPEECVEIEITNDAGVKQRSITDKETIQEVCGLLSGCKNIGMEGSARRLAEKWYETYGNDNVYYVEGSQSVVYKKIPKSESSNDDINGSDGNVAEHDDTEMEAAHNLWFNGERCFTIRTANGFGVFFDFFPVGNGFQCVDGFFDLSEESVKRLSEILK